MPAAAAATNQAQARWQVKVQSRHGEAVVPVRLREDLIPGIMLVPFGFRDHLSPVMEGRDAVAVRVDRT